VIAPRGRAVQSVTEQETLTATLKLRRSSPLRQLRVQLRGQPCVLSVWQKPG